jgi:signal transduction histidine kinase
MDRPAQVHRRPQAADAIVAWIVGPMLAPPYLMILGVVAALAACYALAGVVGETSVVSTAWYVPIVIVAAARLRYAGAVATAVAATALAGPLRSLWTAGTVQSAPMWIGRGVVFTLIGVIAAAGADRLARDRDREQELAEKDRDLTSRQAAVIATVSHEFRTPLTVIGGMARTLEVHGMVEPDGLPFLAGITDATRRLTDLVNTVSAVLDDAGSDTFVRREPVILAEVMPHVLGHLGVRNASSRVTVTIAPGAEIFVTDRELLAQLLRHVIENAVKFSPADLPVDVIARRRNGRLEVRILDRGPGIDDDILRRSDPFVQGDQSTTRTIGGLGLGLFAASRLAAVLGGSIRFLRRHGGGAEAVIAVDAPDADLIALRDEHVESTIARAEDAAD